MTDFRPVIHPPHGVVPFVADNAQFIIRTNQNRGLDPCCLSRPCFRDHHQVLKWMRRVRNGGCPSLSQTSSSPSKLNASLIKSSLPSLNRLGTWVGRFCTHLPSFLPSVSPPRLGLIEDVRHGFNRLLHGGSPLRPSRSEISPFPSPSLAFLGACSPLLPLSILSTPQFNRIRHSSC